MCYLVLFFFSSRRRHTRSLRDWSSDVCSSDLGGWRSETGRALLVRFSPPALAAFTVTVGFGAIQAIRELGTAHALVGSSYGQVLLVKIGLVALMVPLSVLAWRQRRPHLRF